MIGIGRTRPEPKTGYVDRKVGGREHCFNCHHFKKEESGCDGPKMKELSKQPKLKNGDVKVHAVGLCNFWEEM